MGSVCEQGPNESLIPAQYRLRCNRADSSVSGLPYAPSTADFKREPICSRADEHPNCNPTPSYATSDTCPQFSNLLEEVRWDMLQHEQRQARVFDPSPWYINLREGLVAHLQYVCEQFGLQVTTASIAVNYLVRLLDHTPDGLCIFLTRLRATLGIGVSNPYVLLIHLRCYDRIDRATSPHALEPPVKTLLARLLRTNAFGVQRGISPT